MAILNRLVYLLFIAITFFSTFCYGQKVSGFKKITYVYYRSNDSTGTTNVVINSFTDVSPKGECIYKANGYNGENFSYKFIDTTFNISAKLLSSLHKFFSNNRKLSEHIVATKLPPGANFSGPYCYLSYTDVSGYTDQSIIIPGFINQELKDVLAFLKSPPVNNHAAKKLYRDKALEKKILLAHKNCTFIPPASSPPPTVSLKNLKF